MLKNLHLSVLSKLIVVKRLWPLSNPCLALTASHHMTTQLPIFQIGYQPRITCFPLSAQIQTPCLACHAFVQEGRDIFEQYDIYLQSIPVNLGRLLGQL